MYFIGNIEKETLNNKNYRDVIFTSKYMQLVLMNIRPLEDIEFEVHRSDQFIRIEKGKGLLLLGQNREVQYEISNGDAVIIPAGTYHQIINISKKEHLKLYSVYTPPVHQNGHIDIFRPNN